MDVFRNLEEFTITATPEEFDKLAEMIEFMSDSWLFNDDPLSQEIANLIIGANEE